MRSQLLASVSRTALVAALAEAERSRIERARDDITAAQAAFARANPLRAPLVAA